MSATAILRSEKAPTRGMTPAELAAFLRMGRDRIMDLIHSGLLPAIDTAPPGSKRPRYVLLPDDVAAFVRSLRETAARRCTDTPVPSDDQGIVEEAPEAPQTAWSGDTDG